MKETEYIKASNRVKISAALTILRDVLPGAEYGISDDDINEIKIKLSAAEITLFDSYEL